MSREEVKIHELIVDSTDALLSKVASLEAELTRLKEENERLEHRHVRFLVEGGSVVMATEYDRLRSTLAQCVEAMKAGTNALEAEITDCVGSGYVPNAGARQAIQTLRAALSSATSLLGDSLQSSDTVQR